MDDNKTIVSRRFKIYKDFLDTGCDIYKKKSIDIKPGLTILVGCNGIGKTTLIKQLLYILKHEKIPTILFDNLEDGGRNARSRAGFNGNFEFLVSAAFSSEGENIRMNIANFAEKIGTFCKTYQESSELWIFMDAVDSGLSIDNVIELKNLCKLIIDTNPDKHVYIIISANEYELAREESCFDVYRGKYVRFKSYEKYRKFILETRKEKDNRIYTN